MTVSRTYGADRKLSSSDEMLSFEDATELHRALGAPHPGSELTAVVTAVVASVHGENAYVTDIETGLITYVGVSQLHRTSSISAERISVIMAQRPGDHVNAAAGIGAEAVNDLPYECPDCGEPLPFGERM